ncbi:2Fe-2S iron-sulfur cluster-binding protein [Ramlibacter sp.]|uniref:2Fe-2S iron-sulfur cluster-binding protein n=1 Tax=Ramlibacter sp. TaxID=1917967 RepID=UPI002613A910|nr:2Fe-2S iron-sulfur cluster-binding protein [Ramlibacter sp.]
MTMAAPATYQAVLQPSGRSFSASANRTLLAAAAEAGIVLASSCRNGTCRTCLRALHAGSVHYAIPWPGLLPEERSAGNVVLPCVAYPCSDVVLGD